MFLRLIYHRSSASLFNPINCEVVLPRPTKNLSTRAPCPPKTAPVSTSTTSTNTCVFRYIQNYWSSKPSLLYQSANVNLQNSQNLNSHLMIFVTRNLLGNVHQQSTQVKKHKNKTKLRTKCVLVFGCLLFHAKILIATQSSL